MSAHDGADNQLIPLTSNGETQAVMGRDLHTFLESKEPYTRWISRLIEKYGFVAGQDFMTKMSETSDLGGRPKQDHILTLDMAKELSMVQNNDRGRQARQYFIECERRAKEATPALPQDYASALRELAATVEAREIAEKRAAEQESIAHQHAKRLELAAPKVAKADAHSGVTEWKGKQNFYREVQQWGDLQGLDIKQKDIGAMLTRKGMFIAGGRHDSGQITRQSVRNGWGKNEKGVAENGHAYCRPLLSPKGQDIAWKWAVKALEQYGPTLNPIKEEN